jgi:hypothetical protein
MESKVLAECEIRHSKSETYDTHSYHSSQRHHGSGSTPSPQAPPQKDTDIAGMYVVLLMREKKA